MTFDQEVGVGYGLGRSLLTLLLDRAHLGTYKCCMISRGKDLTVCQQKARWSTVKFLFFVVSPVDFCCANR
jgi:hypothetical protein